MSRGLDYAAPKGNEPVLKSAGYDFVCRYLANSGSKVITASEVNRIKAAGLSLVLVWETTANRALDGKAAGVVDATNALKLVEAVGCRDIPAIYFAVDFDASVTQQGAIDDYLRGVASVIGLGRTGVYGGYWVVKRCFDNGTVTWGWQTYAWSGSNWDGRAQLRQILNGQTVAGGSVDIDQSMRDNFGQWPVSGSQPTTNNNDMISRLWSKGKDTVLQVGNDSYALDDERTFDLLYESKNTNPNPEESWKTSPTSKTRLQWDKMVNYDADVANASADGYAKCATDAKTQADKDYAVKLQKANDDLVATQKLLDQRPTQKVEVKVPVDNLGAWDLLKLWWNKITNRS